MRVVRCSMFVVRCSMFDVRCSMFDVRCSMFDVRWKNVNVFLLSMDEKRSTVAGQRLLQPSVYVIPQNPLYVIQQTPCVLQLR